MESLTKYCWGERIQRLLEPALYRKTDEAPQYQEAYSQPQPTYFGKDFYCLSAAL